ncbi:MAG TPA: DJ-1/PfpI family protein [Armatimonadetes bacterium]|nr:DJ-1/PfpI family protein [Armatimonadota bacterium]
MEKVLLIIGDGAEATDTLYPYFRVQEDGYQVVVAGPQKRIYHLVIHDKRPDWDITVESIGYRFASDLSFKDVHPQEYIGLVLPGGRAPEYLRYDQDLMGIVRHFFDVNKPVGCVCHGIEILAAADVIRGKRVTTVPKCRYDAEFSGAIYEDAPVVTDGNLVTARTFWDNALWMREFMKLLNNARNA